MGRPPRRLPCNPPPEHPLPAAEDVLRALAQVMAPLARLLLASGLDYTRLAAELKPLFIEQARLELLRSGQKDTDSAISLLSGVHRKDVREWRANAVPMARIRISATRSSSQPSRVSISSRRRPCSAINRSISSGSST